MSALIITLGRILHDCQYVCALIGKAVEHAAQHAAFVAEQHGEYGLFTGRILAGGEYEILIFIICAAGYANHARRFAHFPYRARAYKLPRAYNALVTVRQDGFVYYKVFAVHKYAPFIIRCVYMRPFRQGR